MYKFSLGIIVIALAGCTAHSYSKPSDLRFQQKNTQNNQVIYVKRDGELCADDTAGQQDCPINFYIDNIKAGGFYIHNSAEYYLKPAVYNLKVKNCTSNECQSCDIEIATDQLTDRNFTLSVEGEGRPFISNAGQILACEAEQQSPQNTPVAPQETTVQINLAADTLFKFDGSSLNDLLPKGREEVLNVASQISSRFVSVSQIKLTGHTDRLGSDQYNQKLGQNRANTVRELLVNNGVAAQIVSTASAGEHEPVTNGCFDVKQREALHACLQPDRRVTVEITGLSK